MKVMIYDRVANDHIPRWLGGFVKYLRSMGHEVYAKNGVFHRFDRKYDHVFMWNGNLPVHSIIKRAATRGGIPFSIVECCWFPQSKYYHIDRSGINAKSSLIEDDLSWVTDDHVKRMKKFAGEYLSGRRHSGIDKYVLCPLQLESDTNIVEHSPFKKMQHFVDFVDDKFRGKRIVFKTHPKRDSVRIRTKSEIVRGGCFLDLAKDAELVCGINSTCLLEATMMNVPVIHLGDGILKPNSHQKRKLIAALIQKQIPVDSMEISTWTKPLFNMDSI